MTTSLSHLRELQKADLTTGDWTCDPDSDVVGLGQKDVARLGYGCLASADSPQSAALIATSHNALPALLAIAEAAVKWRHAQFAACVSEVDVGGCSFVDVVTTTRALLAALDKVKP